MGGFDLRRRLAISRSTRIKHEEDGTLYHVVTRTVQDVFLFDDPVVREWVYRKIIGLGSVYFVDLHAVTVMSNHYHIVLAIRKPTVETAELKRRFEATQLDRAYPHKWFDWRANKTYQKLTDLSEFMKDLNQSIARYVNARNRTTGHVWSDRYKSVLIEHGQGLLTCMAYVELNCVRAGLCAKPSGYRWCSVGRFNSDGAEKSGVVIPMLLGFEGLAEDERQKAFARFVDALADGSDDKDPTLSVDPSERAGAPDQIDLREFSELVLSRNRWMSNSRVLGSEAFCAEMIARFSLQTNRFTGPRPKELGGGLYNGRQRGRKDQN